MLGYMTVRKTELKFREYDRYRAFYCGVCHAINDRYGMISRLSLSYEMTFLCMLLSSLYEDGVNEEKKRCFLHPIKKNAVVSGPETDYCADLSVVITWYALRDGWEDEKRIDRLAESALIKNAAMLSAQRLPRQSKAIKEYVQNLHELERRKEQNLDAAANLTGVMLSELFDWRQDGYTDDLKSLGFSVGKFIYLCDSFEDVQLDIKKNNYNPLITLYGDPDFIGIAEKMMSSVMNCGTLAFERLPLLEDVEILRNILYSGMWQRFELAARRMGESRQ